MIGASSEVGSPHLRILFLVWRLGGGGAERQLAALAVGLASRGHDVTVGVFRRGGEYEDEIEGTNVRLVSFDKRSFWDLVGFFLRVARVVRRLQPDVVHGYMDTGNLVAVAMRVASPGIRVVWGVRSSMRPDIGRNDRPGEILSHLVSAVSRAAHLIISNSRTAARDVITSGYPADRVIVIPNGIDVTRFREDPTAAVQLRATWRVGSSTPIVGMAARLDLMKGYDTFIQAAEILLSRRRDVTFVCVGEGKEPDRTDVLRMFKRSALGDRLQWHGLFHDMRAFYSALTVATCCSRFGEGFSNAIAEAMACGVPCAVTDVGDLPMIVGETGLVVPRENPVALADAWERLIEVAGPDRSAACRQRIVRHFSLPALLDTTERAIRGVVQ